MKSIIKKTLKWTLILIFSIIIGGIVYEQVAQIYLNSKKPGDDAFCKVDGRKVHFVKKGTGGPTIVFQSGLGGDYKIWEEIQDSLSAYTTTISYDRAGLQWSDEMEVPRTMDNITDELHQLLEKTNCPKPYILVGHSLAGITLRSFVQKYPEEVSAVVFVDVAHPLQVKESSEELKQYLVVPPTWLIATLMETGIARTYFSFQPFIADLPAEHWMNKHIRSYFYRSYKTFLKEAVEDDAMFVEAEHIQSFGTLPLTVISAAYPNGADFLGNPSVAAEYLHLHREQQKDLLNLSANSKQVIATNSGHYVPLQDPQLVVKSIREYLAFSKE